jgi:hypothetical protein
MVEILSKRVDLGKSRGMLFFGKRAEQIETIKNI